MRFRRTIPVILLVISLTGVESLGQVNQKHDHRGGHPIGAKYSPDQTLLVVAERKKLSFYMAGTTTFSKEILISKGYIVDFDISSDNKHALIVTSDAVFVYDYHSSTLVHEWKRAAPIIKALFLNSNRIAAITENSFIIYDTELKREVAQKTEHSKPIRSLAYGREKDFVVTGGGDGQLVFYDAESGNVNFKKKVHDNWVRSITISEDASTIASGDDDGKVFINSIDNEEPSRLMNTIGGWVTAVAFSGDLKFLAVGDNRANVYVYDVQNGFLHSKISKGNGEISGVMFRKDGQEVVATEFANHVKVFNTITLNITPIFSLKNARDLTPPQILIANPPNIQDDKIRYFSEMIELKGIILDDAGVRSLKVNGISTPLKSNGNFVIFLSLAMGDNPITLEARDINDNISLKKFTIVRKNLTGEEYTPEKARNYLFVVGIDDYEEWPKLNNAVKDATDLASSLVANYTFDFGNLIMLKNEQATRANVIKGLRTLIEKITPQDNLVIYYSGHGYFDELLNEGYWVPVEGRINSVGDYISNSDILKLVESINSQHTFLVADACFSGALFTASKRGYIENVERYKSRWGLASGRLEAVSDGAVGTNSPFATAFKQFLEENGNKKFAVSELVQYVKVKVAEMSDQTPIGNPLLVSGDEGGEFVFYKK